MYLNKGDPLLQFQLQTNISLVNNKTHKKTTKSSENSYFNLIICFSFPPHIPSLIFLCLWFPFYFIHVIKLRL